MSRLRGRQLELQGIQPVHHLPCHVGKAKSRNMSTANGKMSSGGTTEAFSLKSMGT